MAYGSGDRRCRRWKRRLSPPSRSSAALKTGTASTVAAGGEGATYVERGNSREIAIPARKVKLVSTHGAGDEFIAVLAANLAAGLDIEVALEKVNEAAAIVDFH
ncbi:PfkB family carbohydrate kinase [Rhizobium sp. NPDC090279]|uniref:PfkB family carbohydrate kinase n=1 Tax=Rhizobium sp. NPDC090279 TaxID=3364499 RepID=UPI00383AB362